MTVCRLPDGTIALQGVCPADECEPLLSLIFAEGAAAVDWTACEGAHTAIVQILMAYPGPLIGPPRGSFLRDFVAPALLRIRT